jgi:hypothetical protein
MPHDYIYKGAECLAPVEKRAKLESYRDKRCQRLLWWIATDEHHANPVGDNPLVAR